jgi:hypothetical protein
MPDKPVPFVRNRTLAWAVIFPLMAPSFTYSVE